LYEVVMQRKMEIRKQIMESIKKKQGWLNDYGDVNECKYLQRLYFIMLEKLRYPFDIYILYIYDDYYMLFVWMEGKRLVFKINNYDK
jgi:hypothetical protein